MGKHASVLDAVRKAFAAAIDETIAATRVKSEAGRRISEDEFGRIAKAAYRNLQRVQVKIPVAVKPDDENQNPDPIEVPIIDDGKDKARAEAKAAAEKRKADKAAKK